MTQTYTEMELKTIKTSFSFNYETAEDEKSDNAATCEIQNVAESLKITKKQATGVCLSLRNKNLLYEDEVNGDPIYMITEFGIDEYYRLFGKK